MHLEINFEGMLYQVEVEPKTLAEGAGFFDKMDRDMDNGWQMGMEFADSPDTIMRGQIAASRLVIAIETQNEAMVQAMAGYILSRIPDTVRVNVDTSGELSNTEIIRSGH